ncbi:MAG TPA: hypothetical protein VFE20_08490 [Thermoleophilia bacterium]|nr:hypothetical protein [Thermoleophilia bacterium]
MSEIRRLDPQAWESRGEIVPSGQPEDADLWVDRAEQQGWRWTPVTEPRHYSLVLAVKPPDADAPISYYLARLPDSEQLGRLVGRATAKGLATLSGTVGNLLGPVATRWRDAWGELQERFVDLNQVAALAQISRPQVEAWRREVASFPPSVADREGNPLFLRDEVLAWLAKQTGPLRAEGTAQAEEGEHR